MRKRYLLSVAGGCVLTATLVINAVPVNAQVGNYGYGSSTAAGSGGLPTGPSNLGGIYGVSSSAGSGGAPTGLTNVGTLGYGLSTGAGPAATPTGPTNPVLPQFPPTAGVATPLPFASSTPAIGLPSVTATPGVVSSLPGMPGIGSSGLGIAPARTRRGRTISRGGPIGWRGSIGRHSRISRHGPIGRHRRERTITLLNHLNVHRSRCLCAILNRQHLTHPPLGVAAAAAIGQSRHDIPQIVFVNGLATHGTERPLPWFPIVHQNEFHICLHKKQMISDCLYSDRSAETQDFDQALV